MLDWLEEWNDPTKFSKRLTSQTYAALHHTVYGLLELVRFIKKIQKFYEVGVSAVFIGGVFNICTTMSLVIEVDRTGLAFFLPYLLAMISIIYCHCWCGSAVTYQSAKISYAIFSSKWINADVAYKRLIQIYIQLTSRPLAIRLGGGTFDASLPVFVTVIKTAYSVFTLLQGFEDY
ncbi:unnamed protein product [Acanthoscelides obtectus]|uniref:Uncharacterized protein n=1 Tax=Acanthoscelides obtectus TaxID=200917 RepID=A0A9P0P7J5_ACAOB|nr:unnamed protein product [Acanthoscelides obtectus]CAK1632510.1 Odorant receptor 94b [Acanthoscelides obtectus]